MVMTATIKLLSMLISLAMMLTGTYGVEAPEPASRTLTLSNVTLTANGETVKLNPSVSIGAASEAGKALYDVAVDLNGKKLFPVQVAVTEETLTALIRNADVALTVPASALDELVEAMSDALSTENNPEAEVVMKFVTGELIPAYTRVLKKTGDPAFRAQMTEKYDALLAQVADKGEGEPDVVEIEGDAYDLTRYEYTLTSEQLMELVDLIYTSDEDFEALEKAIFKLYDMMPEGSGLRGYDSFSEMAESMGMDMTADVIERRNDDGTVQVSDVTLTYDFSRMVENLAAQNEQADDADDGGAVGVIGGGEGAEETVETGDAPELQPMVIDVHSEKLGDRISSNATTAYTLEGVTMNLEAASTQEDDLTTMDMTMGVEAGDTNMAYTFSAAKSDTGCQLNLEMNVVPEEDKSFDMVWEFISGANADTADQTFTLTGDIDFQDGDDAFSGSMNVQGENRADGSSHATVSLGGKAAGQTVGLVFDADVGTDPIEDVTTGHDGLVIDDLDRMDEIMEDETNQGVLVQISGSLLADAGALMQDESVVAMGALFTRLTEGAADYEPVEADKTVDGIEPDTAYTGSVETDAENVDAEPVDDGVLPYNEPVFGFLPEGMTVQNTEIDTAYDSVSVSIGDENCENMIFASFNANRHVASYTLDADGNPVISDGNSVQITQPEAGSWIVNMVQDDILVDLYINSETIDVNTIARIVNNLTF